MRNKLGDVLRRIAQRVDGRLFTPVQQRPVVVGSGGAGGGSTSFGVYSSAGGWSKPQLPLVSRKDIEHVALSMGDCFSDAEEAILNRLRAAIGYPPVTKTGHGAGRGWTPK